MKFYAITIHYKRILFTPTWNLLFPTAASGFSANFNRKAHSYMPTAYQRTKIVHFMVVSSSNR